MTFPPLCTPRWDAQPITLALEGGGSLGAFAWGVLDRLVDVPETRIEAVSGTSAGAINAALLVQGLATGGPTRAKYLLETFWRRVAIASGSWPGPVGTWLHMLSDTMAPMVDAMRQTTAAWTSSLGPSGINPLRGILTEMLDPAAFQRSGAPALVVAATCVRTGEARLFYNAEVSVDALLASACLPQLFPAVTIQGESYWDGAYSSNPPISPLIEAGAPADVLIVRTTPLQCPKQPLGNPAVEERLNEITFSAALRSELRSIALAQILPADVVGVPLRLARLRDARLHMIGAEAKFQALPGGSKRDPTWGFLSNMRALGHQAADHWLGDNLSAIGHRSTLDVARFADMGVPGSAVRMAA